MYSTPTYNILLNQSAMKIRLHILWWKYKLENIVSLSNLEQPLKNKIALSEIQFLEKFVMKQGAGHMQWCTHDVKVLLSLTYVFLVCNLKFPLKEG